MTIRYRAAVFPFWSKAMVNLLSTWVLHLPDRPARRSALAGPEAAVADRKPLLESEDQLGVRSPVCLFAEGPDGHGGAWRREHRAPGFRLAGCFKGHENTIQLHGRRSVVLRGPEDWMGLGTAVEGTARPGPEQLVRLGLRHRRRVERGDQRIIQRILDRSHFGRRVLIDLFDEIAVRDLRDEVAHLGDFAPLRLNDLMGELLHARVADLRAL